ncbi:MAG: SurA N-terminal domain-containing protein, partial [Deltaproteobacteria bacterium]|nr:SurA N-terminal domain-containing protein [Deltaproteobacteria bacterium]
MKKTTAAFLTALTLAALSPRVQAEVVDRVVAVVNQEPITLYEVDKLMAANLEEIKKAEGKGMKQEKFQSYRSQALEKLIADKLLDQQMEQMKLQVTDDDVQKALGNIMQRNSMTKEQLVQQLNQKGMSFDQYMVDLRVQLKKVKFMGAVIAPRVKVTDADLDEFFADNSDKFANFQSVQMAQVIVPVDPVAADAELSAAQAKAQEVYQKAKGGSNFEDLGKKYSVNAQTAVPAVYQVNQLAPQIAEVLSGLKAGEVGQPVRSEMGIHVIKLIERKTLAGDEYQAVREQIREKVFELKVQEELEKYVGELKSKNFVQIK